MGCAVSGATPSIAESAALHYGGLLRDRVLRWSAQAHLDEFDALRAEAAVVPAAVVVPASLLVAEHDGRPGAAVVESVLAGYEAGRRFGGASLYGVGWWPTALFGPLGAAAGDGVEVAYLACAGATGSPALLDGPAAPTFGRLPGPASPRRGVHLERCGFKPYPARVRCTP